VTNPDDPFAAPAPGQPPPDRFTKPQRGQPGQPADGPAPGGFTGPSPGQPGYGPPPEYGQPPGQPGYGQPGYGPPPGWGAAGPPTSTKAIIALVLAIASFVVCPLIPAIVALVLASSARQEILASGDRLTGLSLVTGAKVVSWINIGLCAVVLLGIVLLVAVGASTTGSTY
jgi:hypothetical protein